METIVLEQVPLALQQLTALIRLIPTLRISLITTERDIIRSLELIFQSTSKKLSYHLKWEKARFASAILCTSSRFFTAPPSPFTAANNSLAKRLAIVLSRRSDAY